MNFALLFILLPAAFIPGFDRHHRAEAHHPPAERFEGGGVAVGIVLGVHHVRAQRPRLRQRHPHANAEVARFPGNRHDLLSAGDGADEDKGIEGISDRGFRIVNLICAQSAI